MTSGKHALTGLTVRLGGLAAAEFRAAAAEDGLTVAEWVGHRARAELGEYRALSGEISVKGDMHLWDYEPPLSPGGEGYLKLRSPPRCLPPTPDQLALRLGVRSATMMCLTTQGSDWRVAR